MTKIILEKHSPGCLALIMVKVGKWTTPWVCPEYKLLPRDRLGRRHPKALTGFLVWRCNNIACDSQLAILHEDALHLLGITRQSK